MDNLTHSLVGALIGQAGLKRKTGLAMPALVVGANLPDIDATCTIYGIESLAMRRGLTHGPIAWVLLPLALAGILWAFDRWQARRGRRPNDRLPVHFGWLYALAFIACLTHPALDWLNSYGIRLLEPFSSRWFYGDVLFIIDVWLWLGLGLALWLSLRRERRALDWRRPARGALVAAAAYVALNAAVTATVEDTNSDDQGVELVIANPTPVTFWKREVIGGGEGLYLVAGDGGAVRVGEVSLRACALEDARRADRRVDAFLFWSRAPFVERAPDGGWLLRDARVASRGIGGDSFSVPLPGDTCRLAPIARSGS